jgi:hypothetical protein
MRWVDSPAVGATRAPALAATVRANMLAASVDVCARSKGAAFFAQPQKAPREISIKP